ncbi:hypothetical protein [Frigoriflavimonas asaccharolytica]|uniref:Uncharacterized protein n=1 Tax=Frigoriflavimonas asaccharolytica TaxID=2735899 RepID=A0A8J8G9E7_9FLAO|nr:hypothetical protein [Frigoriflavimonas asaccharolytica]NRS93898.1 hypothetical protein [Frigoriflavimonas asaccharolytica]
MQEKAKNKLMKIAEEYILKNAGNHVEVSNTEDHDDIFVFGYQAKDKKVCLVGQGPILLIKKDGRIFEFGSATGKKQALIIVIKKLNKERLIRLFQEDYNIQNNNYDLIITNLDSDDDEELNDLITVLLRNKIYFLVRDENNNVTREYYTKEKLEETLKQTPVNLGGNFFENLEDVLIDLINTSIYFRWKLSEIK